jgi:regulator of PEP synthase PpsR (kinase-PPPase family)
MPRLHLHLLSDSTGETLEMIAKAALAQFEGSDVVRHFWPMVRSQQHLDRIMGEIAANPGLVLFTLVNLDIRAKLEERCRTLGLPVVPALDAVTEALESALGQHPKARPGRQHAMDEAYFARVDAIHFTIAHDDGVAWEDWEEADIVLAGVSRSSKTPTSIYLANRGTVRSQASAGGRPDQLARTAGAGPPQPPACAQPDTRDRLCRQRAGDARSRLCAAHVCRQRLAGDRRHAPLD